MFCSCGCVLLNQKKTKHPRLAEAPIWISTPGTPFRWALSTLACIIDKWRFRLLDRPTAVGLLRRMWRPHLVFPRFVLFCFIGLFRFCFGFFWYSMVEVVVVFNGFFFHQPLGGCTSLHADTSGVSKSMALSRWVERAQV